MRTVGIGAADKIEKKNGSEAKLKKEVKDLKAELNMLKEEIKNLDSENEMLKEDLEAYKKENERLRTSGEELEQEPGKEPGK